MIQASAPANGRPRRAGPRHQASAELRLPAAPLLAKLPREAAPSVGMAAMLATPGRLPAADAPFGYEVKWDGYRTIVRCGAGALALWSRNGNDFAPRFPELAPLRAITRQPLILDGEIVAVDDQGHAHFSALQTRMPGRFGARNGKAWDAARHRIVVMLFDILHLDGRSTRSLPWSERRDILERLHLDGAHWQTPPAHSDGAALLSDMVRTGQEGVIAKRRGSPYRVGARSPDWIKIKNIQSDDFVVVGYWSSGKHSLSSLLLACYASAAHARAGRHLRFCGKVGTGFGEQERARLRAALQRHARQEPPCEGDLPREAGVVWCDPCLVVQLRYSEWTHDGALRHPSYAGIRSDKEVRQVIHREAAPTDPAARRGG